MSTNMETVKSKIEYANTRLKKVVNTSKVPKLPHHKKRWNLFNNLIEAYNAKHDEFKKLNVNYNEFQEIYNKIENKTNRANGQETVEDYFNQKMSEVIKNFQTGKKELNAKIDDLEKSYDQYEKDRKLARTNNRKELFKIRNSLRQAKYALSQLKLNRAKTKKAAKDVGFVSESSFMDSIFNCKKDNLEITYTGMIGTLIKEYTFITENLKNEKYKHISSEIIKLHIDDLTNSSAKKGFEDSKATYIKAIAFSTSTGSTSLGEELKSKITEMENSIKDYLTKIKNEFLAIKIIKPGELKSLCKKYSSGLENLKIGFVKNISPENLVSTYFDMYASSAAVNLDALISRTKNIRINNVSMASQLIIFSALVILLGVDLLALCPPIGIIYIGICLSYLVASAYFLLSSPVPKEKGEKT